jgi:hypothetical protein
MRSRRTSGGLKDWIHQVVVPSAWLLELPTLGAKRRAQVVFGEEIQVLEVNNDWALCRRLIDDYEGWMHRGALRFQPILKPTHRVWAAKTLVLRYPRISAVTIGALYMNSPVQVTKREGIFSWVVRLGWVRTDSLVPIRDYDPDFVRTGELFFNGAPYEWAGIIYDGLDCSGFVQTLLRAAGHKNVPRDTGPQQQTLGKLVIESPDIDTLEHTLKRSDLVFWRGHVALALDSTRVIHACGYSGLVRTQPLVDAAGLRLQKGDGPITCVRRL